MTSTDALEKVLPLFDVYYKIERDDPAPPFMAEAVFSAKDTHYAVYRNVKIGEADSGEILYFIAVEHLTAARAQSLDEKAWDTGLSRVQPGPQHRNTDIGLVILADRVDADADKYIKKCRRHKSYKHMFHGWSNYYLVAIETSSGRLTTNRMGQHFHKLFGNINFLE